jgi:GNAT superfamily N-acetyltransferase
VTEPEPVLRLANTDDEPAIRELLAATLPGNPKTDARVMQWQYHDSPYGEAVRWVWDLAGRIVGCYAALPVPMMIGGTRSKGVISADAATAPDFQGRGLFSRIIEESERYLVSEGIGVVAIFFPAALSMIPRRARGLGWPFRTYILPLNAQWFAERLPVPPGAGRALGSAMFRRPTGDANDVGSSLPDGIDDLWEEMRPSLPFGIVKDETWWRWRFAGHPLKPYRFVGVYDRGRLSAAAVVLDRDALGGRIVYVLELLARTRADARRALGAITTTAPEGTDALALLALPGTPQARAARAGGLRPVPHRLESNPVWLALFDPFGKHREELTGQWSVTWGDMDHL